MILIDYSHTASPSPNGRSQALPFFFYVYTEKGKVQCIIMKGSWSGPVA